MKKISWFAVMLIAVSLISCKDKYSVNTYHEKPESDSLLADIITYVYKRPQEADWQTRFDKQYRKYYVSQLSKFSFHKYHVDEQGIHYYYIIRPARSAEGSIRGVGGTFKMQDNKIVSFREVFNTPVASLPNLQKRGDELFKRLVKHGNVNEYVKHPDYIEWPNEITYYDTTQYEWLVKPGA